MTPADCVMQRRELGWSQLELSRRSGLSRATVAWYEQGYRELKEYEMDMLLKTLKVGEKIVLGKPGPKDAIDVKFKELSEHIRSAHAILKKSIGHCKNEYCDVCRAARKWVGMRDKENKKR